MSAASPSFHIRPADATDLPALASLFDAYRQFYRQPADEALATNFITQRLKRGDAVLLVAEASDDTRRPAAALLGFCQLYPTFCSLVAQPIQILNDLFVAPPARRLGVGRALLLAAEARARQTGVARLELTTARTNATAQALYASLGWVRDEVYFAYSRSIGGT